MEWTIPVNKMLKDEITKLNYTLIPPGLQGDMRIVRVVQDSLGKLIDSLGEQSASAQGLTKVITTAEKFRSAPTQILYLLKDAAGKNGDGELIGYLKVAYKHLYLFDDRDKVQQVEPLCVLDFYVSGARQRRGNGKRLFDHMLQDTDSRVHKLAVDGPSSKMESFLAKNYGVTRLIKQSNNYAVSPEFFSTSPDIKRSACLTPATQSAVGRFSARKPPSSISDVIHGATDRVYHEKDYEYWLKENQEPTTIYTVPVASSSGTPEAHTPQPEAQPEPELDPVSEPEPEPVPEPASPSLERPTTLSVAPAVSPSQVTAGYATSRRDPQITEQGYIDMKFYHNKLW